MDDYYVVDGFESDDIAEEYEALLGPNGFKCVITEPEDRNFGRDLAPIVKKLNTLNSEIKRKDEALEWWLEHACELLPEEPDKEKGIPYKEEYQRGVDFTVSALTKENNK